MSPKPSNLEEVPEDNPFPAKIPPALFGANIFKIGSIIALNSIVLRMNGQSLIGDGKKTWN